MILTHDEHGGFFDHIPPLPIPYNPPNDEYTPFETTGVRVPSIVISPFVTSRSVYKGNLDHTSILQFIAERFAPGEDGYSEAVNERQNQGIGSVSQVLNLDTPRLDIPSVPTIQIQRPALLGLQEGERAKGLMQTAFENATEKMIEEHPSDTKDKYPELYHWVLTRRG